MRTTVDRLEDILDSIRMIQNHLLVHDYFDVDWGVLWDIIQIHIEPLREQVELLIHDSAGR